MFELEWAALLEGVTTTEATAAAEVAVAEWEFPFAAGFMTKRAWMRSWPKRGRPLQRLSLKRAITFSEGDQKMRKSIWGKMAFLPRVFNVPSDVF